MQTKIISKWCWLRVRPNLNKKVDRKKKAKYIGLLGALLVHTGVIVLLLSVGFALPQPQEEGGMAVVMGDSPQAGGKPSSLVEVDVMPAMPEEPVSETPQTSDEDLITQELEESVAIDEARKKEEEERLRKEKEEEQRRIAREEAERKRKAAEEAARRTVAGAFGKGAQMGNADDAREPGERGSREGNASEGTPEGTGGYGTFSLDGRSIGTGGLPRPVYNVQDEGRVVVTITVNPAGVVVATSINPQTNTVNTALRKAAEDAARKARFNAVDGVDNQIGTITYYFNLK